MAKQHGFFSYNRGEEPNFPLLFLSLFCCGIGYTVVNFGVLKAASQVLKDDFPEQLGRNIICAIFPIAGAFLMDPILTKKEQELGIANAEPRMKLYGLLYICCALLAPLYTAGLIKRLNAIDAAINQ